MALQRWFDHATQQPESNGGGVIVGAPKALGLTVTREEWCQAAEDMATHGGRLLSLWASRNGTEDDAVRAAFIADLGVLVLSLPVTASDAHYPGIEQWFPSASRMQRAVTDLSGLRSTDADARPWLRHAAWPDTFHPLIDDDAPLSPMVPVTNHYAFVRWWTAMACMKSRWVLSTPESLNPAISDSRWSVKKSSGSRNV